MNEAQKRAWDCLREDERQSLFLQMSTGKSSWEAGTIMKRSHYKYIEIRERSQVFFKLFTEFFEKHESIFRPDAPFKRVFMDYIEACIEKRLNIKHASLYTGETSNRQVKIRESMLTHNLRLLYDSNDPWDIDTKALIIEFDRWNNFRILPKMYQAPSPYGRRVVKRYKAYIKYLLSKKFPTWAYERISERFRTRSLQCYYVVFISTELYVNGYLIVRVKKTEECLREMTRFFIYVFADESDAENFAFMVVNNRLRTNSIKSGQKFWKEFRLLLEDAVNYKELNNIEFNRVALSSTYSSIS